MASINFLVLTATNPANIYVRLRTTTKDFKVITPLLIDPEKWSQKKKQPKNLKDADGKRLLNKMEDIRAKIISALSDLDNEADLSKNWLKDLLVDKALLSQKRLTLADYFDLYYEKKFELNASLSLLKKVRSVQNLVLRFQKSQKKSFQVQDVDEDWVHRFQKFMSYADYKQGYIFRVVKSIKTVCRFANSKGEKLADSFDSAVVAKGEAPKIFLNLHEIKQIKEAEMPNEHLDNARDWLVISCFLGQRVSDLMRCSSDKIKVLNNGRVIDLRQKKTKKELFVAITPEVEMILRKRDGEFPRPISDVKYNLYIKEVCKVSGISKLIHGDLYDPESDRNRSGMYEKWKLVTSHIGRRSFATNFYGKIPITYLMAQTGHTTERSFLEYIGKGRLDQVSELLDYF